MTRPKYLLIFPLKKKDSPAPETIERLRVESEARRQNIFDENVVRRQREFVPECQLQEEEERLRSNEFDVLLNATADAFRTQSLGWDLQFKEAELEQERTFEAKEGSRERRFKDGETKRADDFERSQVLRAQRSKVLAELRALYIQQGHQAREATCKELEIQMGEQLDRIIRFQDDSFATAESKRDEIVKELLNVAQSNANSRVNPVKLDEDKPHTFNKPRANSTNGSARNVADRASTSSTRTGSNRPSALLMFPDGMPVNSPNPSEASDSTQNSVDDHYTSDISGKRSSEMSGKRSVHFTPPLQNTHEVDCSASQRLEAPRNIDHSFQNILHEDAGEHSHNNDSDPKNARNPDDFANKGYRELDRLYGVSDSAEEHNDSRWTTNGGNSMFIGGIMGHSSQSPSPPSHDFPVIPRSGAGSLDGSKNFHNIAESTSSRHSVHSEDRDHYDHGDEKPIIGSFHFDNGDSGVDQNPVSTPPGSAHADRSSVHPSNPSTHLETPHVVPLTADNTTFTAQRTDKKKRGTNTVVDDLLFREAQEKREKQFLFEEEERATAFAQAEGKRDGAEALRESAFEEQTYHHDQVFSTTMNHNQRRFTEMEEARSHDEERRNQCSDESVEMQDQLFEESLTWFQREYEAMDAAESAFVGAIQWRVAFLDEKQRRMLAQAKDRRDKAFAKAQSRRREELMIPAEIRTRSSSALSIEPTLLIPEQDSVSLDGSSVASLIESFAGGDSEPFDVADSAPRFSESGSPSPAVGFALQALGKDVKLRDTLPVPGAENRPLPGEQPYHAQQRRQQHVFEKSQVEQMRSFQTNVQRQRHVFQVAETKRREQFEAAQRTRKEASSTKERQRATQFTAAQRLRQKQLFKAAEVQREARFCSAELDRNRAFRMSQRGRETGFHLFQQELRKKCHEVESNRREDFGRWELRMTLVLQQREFKEREAFADEEDLRIREFAKVFLGHT